MQNAVFCRSNKSTPRSSRSSQQNGNLDNRRQNGSHDNGRENGNLDDRTHEFGTSTGRMKVSDFLSQSLEPRGERTLQPGAYLLSKTVINIAPQSFREGNIFRRVCLSVTTEDPHPSPTPPPHPAAWDPLPSLPTNMRTPPQPNPHTCSNLSTSGPLPLPDLLASSWLAFD